MSNTWRAILALTTFFALAPQANAGVITIFNNRALFNTLADPNVLLTFDKIGPPPSSPGYVYCQLTCDLTVDDALVLASFYGLESSFFGGHVTFPQAGASLLSSVAFPFPSMTALGFDVTGTALLSFSLRSPGSGPSIASGFLNVTGPTFFGFISDSPFNFFFLQALPLEFPNAPPNLPPFTDPAVLDNLAIRTVPEPSTISLLIGGLIVVLASRRVPIRR